MNEVLLMYLLCLCLFAIWYDPFDWLVHDSLKWATHLNIFCLQATPSNIQEKAAWQALICGRMNLDKDLQNFLQVSGLIHIFVVSGSHLIILKAILKFLRIPNYLTNFLMGFYVLLTGVQAPVTRALCQQTFREIVLRQRLGLRPDQCIFFAGAILLIIFPEWSRSYSLLLSWYASLALYLGRSNPIKQAFFIYFLLLIPLCGIGNYHPLVLIFSLVLCPLIGGILFPLGLLIWPFPILSPFFDRMVTLLRILGTHLSSHWNLMAEPLHTQYRMETYWTGLWGLHFCIHLYLIQKNRRLLCSSS